jgi:hypothetical protein
VWTGEFDSAAGALWLIEEGHVALIGEFAATVQAKASGVDHQATSDNAQIYDERLRAQSEVADLDSLTA